MDFLGNLKDEIKASLDAIQKAFSHATPTVTTSCAACECVHTITATVASTSGVRKSTDIRPANVLKASSVSDESLTGNAPVILVRGCKEVMLAAGTTPKDKPVKWTVKPNENSDAPPAITPYDGGRKAKLETNVHGSFSVIATLGSCKVVWNVVFVWVKVDVKSSVIVRRNNKYSDNGSTAFYTKFRSGLFATGQYPWEARVKVKVIGGGVSKTLGTSKVKLHILQNAVTDTLAGNYAPGEKAEEVPKGGLPIRDSNGATNPWADDNYSPTVTPDNISVKREVTTGDSPTGGFLTSHQKNGQCASVRRRCQCLHSRYRFSQR